MGHCQRYMYKCKGPSNPCGVVILPHHSTLSTVTVPTDKALQAPKVWHRFVTPGLCTQQACDVDIPTRIRAPHYLSGTALPDIGEVKTALECIKS